MSEQENNTKANNGEQYLKDMNFNKLLFEQKLQKLKKKAKELQIKNKEMNKYKTKPLNQNLEKKDAISERSKKIGTNKKYAKIFVKNDNNKNNDEILNSAKKLNNTNKIYNKYSRNESQEILSSFNLEYSINNDTNASMNNINNTIDDELFNDNSIRKDYKIKELIKKNKQLKSEIEYKNNIIESLEKEIKQLKENKDYKNDNNTNNNIDTQNKLIDEINFELGKLTREIEEKNQKIENYEINYKNLNIKIENLILQNKNLSNREKKMMDENEYLITNMDKIKDENEKYKTKIIQIETLKQNVLKDYEELSNNFLKLKKQKEKAESLSEEQKSKILNLKNELKAMHNLLEETIKKQKRKKHYNYNNNYTESEEEENDNNTRKRRNKNLKLTMNNYQYNDENDNSLDSIGYENYDNPYNKNIYQLNPSKTSFQFYPKNKIVTFDNEYDNNDNYNNIYNNKFYNKIKNNNYNTNNINEEERRFNEIIGDRPSKLKRKKSHNKSYYDIYEQEDIDNEVYNDKYLNHNFSSFNIFNRNDLIKRKNLSNINNDIGQRKKLNGKQIKDPITNEYIDYDGYEGFNCFPSEKTQKILSNEIDELNHDLNILLKNKNIMENNLINLPGHSKTINNILKKKELNHKILQTETKINEIRVRLKQLKGV